MKNTSLFVSFWAMPKRKPSVEPPEADGSSVTLAPGVIGGGECRPLIASYCKNAKSGHNFPDFSYPLFIYCKSDTTLFWCCGSLCTFVLICYLEFTFHVKLCVSIIKYVNISSDINKYCLYLHPKSVSYCF